MADAVSTRRLGTGPRQRDRRLAASGRRFGLVHFPAATSSALVGGMCVGLRWLMQRDPFQGDRLSSLYDVRQITGIRLAAAAVDDQIPELSGWLRDALRNPCRQVAGRFDDLVARHTLAVLDGGSVQVTDAASMTGPGELALVHWMISAGTASLSDRT